jgi:hypothetical protein
MTRVLPYLPPRDLRKFKESKKHFDKVSEEKEAALARNAQAPRNKQHEVEEATNILTATLSAFTHMWMFVFDRDTCCPCSWALADENLGILTVASP